MAQIEFVVPDPTTNYFENPRFGNGTTGLTLVNSALTHTSARARWGMYSTQVVTNGGVAFEGCYATVNIAAPGTAAEFYSGSVYLRGAGIVRVRLVDQTHTINFVSEEVQLNDTKWKRVGVSGFIPAGCLVLRLYVETVTTQLVTFYVDGVQIEDKEYVTSYTDGDLENEIPPHDGNVYWKWIGLQHASASTRSAECRLGGKTEIVKNIDAELFITDMSGLGMPIIENHISEYATMDRATVEGWKTLPRTVQLHFYARKDKNTKACSPASLHQLHRARQKLEEIIKPDKAPHAQPFLMRYQDGKDTTKVELFVTYDSGLEWAGDIRDPFINDFMVRFLAADPYFYEDTQDVHVPTGYQLLLNAGRILARIEGEWQIIGTCDGSVYKIAVAPNGDIYAAGTFSGMSGVANTAYIARYDGENWNALAGATNLNGAVRAVDFLPDGRVMLGGQFTQFGITACNYICIYDPVADNYTTAGQAPGFDWYVYDFALNDDGKMYVVGLFQTDALAARVFNYICRYDPPVDRFDQLVHAGGIGLNDRAVCCSTDNDGEILYVGGIFTTYTGGPANALDSLTYWDPNTNSFNAMGTGLNAVVWILDILCTHDNNVYAVGEFTHIGYVDADYVGVWNGEEWYPLGVEGDGFTLNAGGASARSLCEDYKGLLWIGGDFIEATDAPLAGAICTWNRSRFQHRDVVIPGQTRGYTIACKNDDVWIGFRDTGTGKAAEVFTVDNIGKATTYPVLEILGPCHIQWLENQTTGDIVRLDLDIMNGERVTFDFRPWNRFVKSTVRKNAEKGVLQDSDDFRLLPGENQIAIFCEDVEPYTDGTEISLRWPIVHWSFDDLR